MKYDLDWVRQQYDTGLRLKYIFFWGHHPQRNGQVGKSCLSQWWPSVFIVDDLSYGSAEHWMMAEKARLFNDQTALQKILDSSSPAEAKKWGRTVRGFEEKAWNTHRYDIVKTGNLHKFRQHPDLWEYLQNTASRILVEASPDDTIWGIGMKEGDADIENPYTWQGSNLLGFALMEVRDELLGKR